MHCRSTIMSLTISLLLISALSSASETPNLDIRPRPQVVTYRGEGFEVTEKTRILIPKNWPGYIDASAKELALALKEKTGLDIAIVEEERMKPGAGDIAIGLHWVVRPEWIEPLAEGLVRPSRDEGHNILIDEHNVAVMGNAERGCFCGIQTLIQVVRQTKREEGAAFVLPGVLISDWPEHNWRTLQFPFGVYGCTYDRGEHRYRHITKTDLLERSIRLAAFSKMTGLRVEVGTGMEYARHPEIFVEGFSTNSKEDVVRAVNLAKSLGLELIPFLNVSAGHDIWFDPYPCAVPNSDIYMEELFDIFDETLEVFRPTCLHIGMDEDVARDLDGNLLRDVETHKRVMMECHDFLRRRGVATMVWHDGLELLKQEKYDLPRDIIVFPWYYGGWDFKNAESYIDMGFRILCSPWSQWHVENDQFYSIYASTVKSDKLLGMAGTIWYPIPPDAENDYRRCLVKAAMAFWSPLKAGDFPNDKSYYAPEYASLTGESTPVLVPREIRPEERDRLVKLVLSTEGDVFECEAAREGLVKAGTAVVPALLEGMSRNPDEVCPWAEGTLRRIAREPVGDLNIMRKALRKHSSGKGAFRDLVVEMIGATGDVEFIAGIPESGDPAVCEAMGLTGDARFLSRLIEPASKSGPAQVSALESLGRLGGLKELLSLEHLWKAFPDDAREAYARSLAMQASEDALAVLGEMASDKNWRVRFRAAIGLGATRSEKAGKYILAALEDDRPEVFKAGLHWCTDTFILAPEDYFPALVDHLKSDGDEAFINPILHAMLLMWDRHRGAWLSKGEDASRRIDYEKLPVWRDKKLIGALNDLIGHRNATTSISAIFLLIKCGGDLPAKKVADAVKSYERVEDQRWFCERVRDLGAAGMEPIMREVWGIDDRLVRTFIIQYCGRVRTDQAFALVQEAYGDLGEGDQQLKDSIVFTMAGILKTLDEKARTSIPLILELYGRSEWPEGRENLDDALCRVSGKEPLDRVIREKEEAAKRLEMWREWWETAGN